MLAYRSFKKLAPTVPQHRPEARKRRSVTFWQLSGAGNCRRRVTGGRQATHNMRQRPDCPQSRPSPMGSGRSGLPAPECLTETHRTGFGQRDTAMALAAEGLRSDRFFATTAPHRQRGRETAGCPPFRWAGQVAVTAGTPFPIFPASEGGTGLKVAACARTRA